MVSDPEDRVKFAGGQVLRLHQQQRVMAAAHPGGIDALIEGGQFSAPFHGECQQVAVGEVLGGWESGEKLGIAEGDIIRPELVAGGGLPLSQGFTSDLRAAGTIRERRVSDDTHEAIFCDGAGSPAFYRIFLEK